MAVVVASSDGNGGPFTVIINKYSFIMTSDKPQMKYNGSHRY